MSGVYTLRRVITNPGTDVLIQVKAGTGRPLEILRAWVSQRDSVTSDQVGVKIVRKSTPATVTAAVANDIAAHDETSPASSVSVGTAATGYDSSANGTDTAAGGQVGPAEGFNVLNGWLYIPIPEERIRVAGDGTIALELTETPPAADYEAGITWREI